MPTKPETDSLRPKAAAWEDWQRRVIKATALGRSPCGVCKQAACKCLRFRHSDFTTHAQQDSKAARALMRRIPPFPSTVVIHSKEALNAN